MSVPVAVSIPPDAWAMSVTTSRRTSCLFLVLVPFLLGSGPDHESARKDPPAGYTLASVQGTYALSYVFTAFKDNDSAALGLARFDGQGRFEGSFIQNWPGPVCRLPADTRCVAPGTNVGTYTMNEDGIGHITLTNTFSGHDPGAGTTQLSFDGVVTQARAGRASRLATEIFNIQAERSFVQSIGGLASGVAKRLPAEGEFRTESLRGAYAVGSVVGAIPSGALGVATFDGSGSVSSTLTVNLRRTRGDRQVIRGIVGVGTYSVNADGTGAFTLTSTHPDGSSLGEGNFDLVVMQAEVAGSLKVAREFFAIQREPGALSKAVVALVFKKLPD